MSNRTKLKPCPFCGGEAKLLIVGKRADGGEEWYVGCENENCSLHPHSTIPYVSAEIAAEAWNRRAENTGSAHVGDMAAMRKSLEVLRELLGDLLRLEDAEYHNDFLNFCDIIDNALAAPARNCDKCKLAGVAVALAVEAGVVDCNFGAREMAEFLLAEAKGEKK